MKNSAMDQSFFQAPAEIDVGKWKVQFISFIAPKNAHKTPVIILGGVFQKFVSFRYEVSQLSKDSPVYLVDLPGQGTNIQSSSDLDFEEYAGILKGFLDKLGIEKVSLISLSYGSNIGHHFASLFPERCQKVILGGITNCLRRSVKEILSENIEALTKNEMGSFASGVALNLMNFSQRARIENSEVVRKALQRKAHRLNDIEKKLFVDNVKRLIKLESLPRVSDVDMLVISGEFDNFTTPFEGFEVAKNVLNSQYAIVSGVDHLGFYEKKDVMTRLYRRFLSGQALNRMKDVELFEKVDFPRERIRMEPRFQFNDVAFLDGGKGPYVPINVININNFGCKLFTSFKDHKIIRENKKFTLHFPENDVQIEMFLHELGEEGQFRGIFKHHDMGMTKNFENFINRIVAQGTDLAWPA